MSILGGKDLETLEEESQRKDTELQIEEKKALIRQAKAKWGSSWKEKLGGLLKGKSGINWTELKFRVGNTNRLRGRF